MAPGTRSRYLPTKNGWLLGSASFVIGVALIIVGASLDDYAASVLANVGTAVLLVLPLVVLERALEVRVEEARSNLEQQVEQVGGNVADLDQRVTALTKLTERTRERITSERDTHLAEAVAPADRIVADPSFVTVYEAIEHARTRKAIGSGVYIPRAEASLILEFKVMEEVSRPLLQIRVLGENGVAAPLHSYWKRGQTAEDLFVDLDTHLHRAWGADAPTLDSGAVLRQLADTLREAERRAFAAGRGREVPVLAIPTQHWVVLPTRLEHIDESARSFDADDVLQVGSAVLALPAGIPHAEELPYAWRAAHGCWSDFRRDPRNKAER